MTEINIEWLDQLVECAETGDTRTRTMVAGWNSVTGRDVLSFGDGAWAIVVVPSLSPNGELVDRHVVGNGIIEDARHADDNDYELALLAARAQCLDKAATIMLDTKRTGALDQAAAAVIFDYAETVSQAVATADDDERADLLEKADQILTGELSTDRWVFIIEPASDGRDSWWEWELTEGPDTVATGELNADDDLGETVPMPNDVVSLAGEGA